MPSAQPLTLQLVLPGLVYEPANAWSAALPAFPALKRLLARAKLHTAPCDHLAALLLDQFGVSRQTDWPAAAFSLLGEGTDPGPHTWLRADPVHLLPQQSALVLGDVPRLDLSSEESEALLLTLNRHFGAAALAFCAPSASRWYVRLPKALQIQTVPPEAAAGHSVDLLLPRGADALRVHGWFNEIQMLLHDHPVNLAREERGEAAVNTLWIWGAGHLARTRGRTASGVWTADPLLRGLARASDSPVHAPPASADDFLENAQAGEHWILLDLAAGGGPADPRADAEQLERLWFGPLLAALAARRVRNLTLITCHHQQALRFSVGPADLWKVWRRKVDLAHD